MKILIVDDVIETSMYIKSVILDKHSDWTINCVSNYDEALSIVSSDTYDLFILDYMLESPTKNTISEKNGLYLGLAIKSIDKYKFTPVIFETGFPEYILDVTNKLYCIYFLVKPFDEYDIYNMIDKINSSRIVAKELVIKDISGVCYKLSIDDIIYIESKRHQLFIQTKLGLINTSRNVLTDFNASNLFRCHKSYVINLEHIFAYDATIPVFNLRHPIDHKIISIPIGRTYIQMAKERWNKISV